MSQAIDILQAELKRLATLVKCQQKQIDDMQAEINESLSCCEFVTDFTVNIGEGNSIGGLEDGEVIDAGTSSVEALIEMLTNRVAPEYTAPTVVLTSNNSSAQFEVGDTLSITFNYTFTENDAGDVSSLSLKRNGTQISPVMPYTDVLSAATTLTYILEVAYEAGPCKVDNFGDLDCTGRITDGVVTSNSIVYPVYRKAFYGTPGTLPTNSAQVRGMSSFLWNPVANTGVSATGVDLVAAPTPSFNMVIGPAVQRITFAYPATLRDLASVRVQELGDMEVKGLFSVSTVSVTGANTLSPINYKVYTYAPAEAFASTVNYKIYI